MTNEEALKRVMHGDYASADENIIAALKKQIPKEPKLDPHKIDGLYRFGYCPACNEVVFIGMKYCANCGQALNWSGENERVYL